MTPIVKFEQRIFNGYSGVPIAADVGGNPENPTIILSHGGGQTRHSWAGAMRALAAVGYHVINYDLRGHGDSGWSPEGAYSLHERSHDLLSIVAETRGPVGLVGLSMGGNTSLYTAATNQEINVGAVVLVDIVPNPDAAGVQRVQDFMLRHIDGFDNIEEVADAVAAYNPARPRPSDPNGLRKNLRERNGRLYWHWDPKVVRTTREEEHGLMGKALAAAQRPLDFPTLLVHGMMSDVVSERGVAEMRAYLPQTEIFDVAGAGHMVAGDKNDVFNSGIIAFLEKHLPIQ